MNIYNMTSRFNFKSLNKLAIVVTLCLGVGYAFGQGTQGDPFQYNPSDKMFSPTPEQASLMKFTDIPSANYTGVHGFSVPIYTIAGKDFSLPISINYHGGGVKVDELSSSVGLGWALNVGGISFSEEVRGERDFDTNIQKLNYFNPEDFDPFYDDIIQGGSAHYWDAMRMVGMQVIGLSGVPVAELQPDYFSYSLINNKGRFIWDNGNDANSITKKAHTIPKDDILILHPQIYSTSTKQVLVDNKGIYYHFSSYLQDHSPGTSSSSFVPRKRFSYKIDSIVVPNSGSIKFEYYNVSYKYISSRAQTKKLKSIRSTFVESSSDVYETVSTITEYLPKSVLYNNTKIDFKYKMAGNQFLGRIDVNQGGDGEMGKKGAILEYIEVVNTSNSSVPLKKFKLITDYFDNNNTGNVLYNRLRLKKIEDLVLSTDYTFKYVGEDTNKYLPPRFSYSQDHWGMYNGKDNSTSVPEYLNYNGQKGQYIPGANKHPDKNFAEIGSLSSIKLPTGGYQLFEYELDEFRNTSFLDEYNYLPIHDFQEMNFQITGGDTHNFGVGYPIIAEEDSSVDFSKGYNYSFYFDYANNPNIGLEDGDQPILGTTYYVAILLKNGIEQNLRIYGGYFTPPDDYFESGNSYSVLIRKVGGGAITPFATLDIKWINNYITYPQNRSIGTLRVKSITLRESENNPNSDLIKRSYYYKDFDDYNHPQISSGIFTGKNTFPWAYLTSYEFMDTNSPVIETFLNIPNSNSTSLGKSVLYEKVTEIYECTKECGNSPSYKKDYIFSLPISENKLIIEENQTVPNLPPPHIDYLSGLLLEERMKNSSNLLVSKTINKYNNDNLDLFFNQFSYNYHPYYNYALSPSLAVANTGLHILPQGGVDLEMYQFEKSYSHIYSAWVKLLESTTETYENGVKTMSQTQKYKYDDSNNQFKNIHPIETSTTNSFGQEIKTEYEYNHPYKKNEPTTVRQYENGLSVSVQQTKFYPSGLPQYVFAKKAASTLDNVPPSDDLKITYERYDAYGNLQQYRLADGTPVSIIWGYNGHYPIAKVEGKTYNEIATIAQTLITDSNSTYGLQPSYFNNLRSLEGALVTCYIYKPLVGVTTIIQPNGQREIYEYDDAGRLTQVKDHNGNILQKNEYHYKD